jgi:hypothetical protein
MREEHGGTPADATDTGAAPGRQRQLDRAPGERYRTRPGAAGPPGSAAAGAGPSAILRAATPFLVALGGALLVAVLGSFDIGSGLLAVSAFIGWAVGLAIVWGGTPGRRGRTGAWSAGLAAASIVLGFVILWAWSRVEGGVMDPVAYLDVRFGPVAYLDIAVAAVAAWLRAH